ncbi:hypothetical protein CISG_07049 [Coccidioides immitis RMSCC 3703]|uniref:Uncharacterized protein n=1 Tax=Coccidioides immitis RMSCC 3703 TaxID=454286 RepID=A0A0J8QZA2_COCIT|nr:hypothetical protein CISG_07049 [Coccidioides immitis RMSCC 3703]
MSSLNLRSENTSQQPPTEADLKNGFTLKAAPGTDLWSKPPSTVRSNAPTITRAIALSRFQRARVHVSADWSTLYDQGGLVLMMEHKARKWIKTGIEFVSGRPYKGALWVYVVEKREGEEIMVPVREITWAFAEEEDVKALAGVYACRPAKEGGELDVVFRDFELELNPARATESELGRSFAQGGLELVTGKRARCHTIISPSSRGLHPAVSAPSITRSIHDCVCWLCLRSSWWSVLRIYDKLGFY